MQSRIDFAVITMREDETNAVHRRITDIRAFPRNNRTYVLGELKNIWRNTVLIACKRTPSQGQLAAQDTARNIIEDLDPAWIVLVGICGAPPDSEFTLGDVIIATRVHAFTLGALKEGK